MFVVLFFIAVCFREITLHIHCEYCFFAKTSSNNYDECIKLSNQYLQDVITSLNADHFDSGIADIDLCCAIKAKLFIQGKGFFSKLIVEIRKKLNLNNIETDN